MGPIWYYEHEKNQQLIANLALKLATGLFSRAAKQV